jgi:hypothetical protein
MCEVKHPLILLVSVPRYLKLCIEGQKEKKQGQMWPRLIIISINLKKICLSLYQRVSWVGITFWQDRRLYPGQSRAIAAFPGHFAVPEFCRSPLLLFGFKNYPFDQRQLKLPAGNL